MWKRRRRQTETSQHNGFVFGVERPEWGAMHAEMPMDRLSFPCLEIEPQIREILDMLSFLRVISVCYAGWARQETLHQLMPFSAVRIASYNSRFWHRDPFTIGKKSG